MSNKKTDQFTLPTTNKTIYEILNCIKEKNEAISNFWSNAHGWAPSSAAELLSKSRLDWQVHLSQALQIWIDLKKEEINDGVLILAWANLGALVEGSMKLILCVYYDDYISDPDVIKMRGDIVEPDIIGYEQLKQFFSKKLKHIYENYKDLISLVQLRRNAIHAFKNRDVGTMEEVKENIIKYKDFLFNMNSCLPYP